MFNLAEWMKYNKIKGVKMENIELSIKLMFLRGIGISVEIWNETPILMYFFHISVANCNIYSEMKVS